MTAPHWLVLRQRAPFHNARSVLALIDKLCFGFFASFSEENGMPDAVTPSPLPPLRLPTSPHPLALSVQLAFHSIILDVLSSCFVVVVSFQVVGSRFSRSYGAGLRNVYIESHLQGRRKISEDEWMAGI